MANDKYLSLYVGNHGKHDGIEDYIALISTLMGERDIPVRVATALDPGAVNLVIDEFTNYVENHRVSAFKEAHPDSKIVYVLTEFAGRKWGVESFNHFGGVFESAAIALFNVYLRLVRDDFGRLDFVSLFKLLCYSPLLMFQFIYDTSVFVVGRLIGKRTQNPADKYARKYRRTIYFHMRYLGLKACLRYADAVITSHEKIIDGFMDDRGADGERLRNFGVLYPELDEREVLDKLMVGKKLFVEITGSVTPYRQSWIERINGRLLSLGLHNVFGNCIALPFSALLSSKPIERGAYSLHPPQTPTWPYCSPTRIFRALAVDNNLPVLTHHFHQNPIEDVCFLFEDKRSIIELYEMYFDPALLKKFIEPKVKRYNEIAIKRNDDLVEKLRAIMCEQELAA